MSRNDALDLTVDEKDMPATDAAISELFEGIESIYFSDYGLFSPISNELEKLSNANLEIDELERERFKLKRQMQVVSKKITTFTMKNSFEFNKNVENYEIIRENAEEIFGIVQRLRKKIGYANQKCIMASTMLAHEFKRRTLNGLRDEISIIKSIHKNELKMKEIIQEGSPFEIVHFAVEALNMMKVYTKYSSVKQLYAGLLNLLGAEEIKMDFLLASQVNYLLPERYGIIYEAYNLLGDMKRVSTNLQKYFASAFLMAARMAIISFIQNFPENESANMDELSFEELLKLIDHSHFARVLVDVGTALIQLLANYHAFLRFHMEEDKKGENCGKNGMTDPGEDIVDELSETTVIVERGIVQKSLLDNLHSIFKTAADIYDAILSRLQPTHLKFEQFLKIIEISEKFRGFGLRHFGNSYPNIISTLKNQSNTFFRQYHSERLDELKMFLENETFTLCPVPMQFSLFDLPEFHYLKVSNPFDDNESIIERCFEIDVDTSDNKLNFILMEETAKLTDVFPQWQIEDSPCHSLKYQTSISTVDTPDEEDEVGDASQFGQVKSMPNFCNTALNILRIIGRYVKMSRILQCTSEQTIDAIFQLYNYFIYTLYKYFCMDFSLQQQQMEFGTNFCPLRLRQLMESIENNYFKQSESQEEKITPMVLPMMCLPMDDEATLFSLAERIIGIESGILLSKQMELLRPILEALIPPKMHEQKLGAFYKTLPIASDLLDAAIGCVAAKALPYKSINKQIQSANWNIGEIPSQHSAYVDSILKEFQEFKAKFSKLHAYVHVGPELNQIVWSMLAFCTMRTLVQGYSEVKKCTAEGRAFQLMDIEQLCNSLEELSGIKPLPHRSHAENYIKAFFLPHDELNQWIVHHTEYSLDQTSALLNAASPSTATKKTATMSRIMMNLLDASGMGESSNKPLFQ